MYCMRFETRSHYSSTPLQRDTAPEPRRIQRKEIEIRRYTGKYSVEDYPLQFELTARHNYWTDQEKTSSLGLLCALDGPARDVLAEIDDITSVSYHEVRWALLARFGPADLPAAHEQALQQLQLNHGQNIRELSKEVQRLTRRAYGDLAGRTRNQLMVGFLLRAISNRHAVFYIKHNALDDVCTLYERFRLLSNPGSQRHPTARVAQIEEGEETVGAAQDGGNTNVSECALSHAMQTLMDRTSRCLEQMSHT